MATLLPPLLEPLPPQDPVPEPESPSDLAVAEASRPSAMKQRFADPALRQKISAALKGRPKPPGFGKKRAILTAAQWRDPEIRSKMVAGQRGKLRSPSTKRRISSSLREYWATTPRQPRRPRSPEARARMSEAATRRWADPEARRRHSEAVRAGKLAAALRSPTEPEAKSA